MSAVQQQMLQRVEEYRREQCEAAHARARAAAAEQRQAAHRAARSRMHQHLEELRQYRTRELARAAAELATAERLHQSRCDAALLATGWSRLIDVLRARWQDPDARRLWIEALAGGARAALPPGVWEVFHPRDWPVAEQQTLADRCRPKAVIRRFVPQDEIVAGLRLCADGACLDGTLAGLLADRSAVEARLLAEIG